MQNSLARKVDLQDSSAPQNSSASNLPQNAIVDNDINATLSSIKSTIQNNLSNGLKNIVSAQQAPQKDSETQMTQDADKQDRYDPPANTSKKGDVFVLTKVIEDNGSIRDVTPQKPDFPESDQALSNLAPSEDLIKNGDKNGSSTHQKPEQTTVFETQQNVVEALHKNVDSHQKHEEKTEQNPDLKPESSIDEDFSNPLDDRDHYQKESKSNTQDEDLALNQNLEQNFELNTDAFLTNEIDTENEQLHNEDVLQQSHIEPEQITEFDKAPDTAFGKALFVDNQSKFPKQATEDAMTFTPSPSDSSTYETFSEEKGVSYENYESQEDIASSETLSESAAAFAALTEMTKKMQNISPKSSSAQKVDSQNAGNYTVDELMRELLRPLLKEWLDAHLPSLVKWLVTEQIEKILQQQLGFVPGKQATPAESAQQPSQQSANAPKTAQQPAASKPSEPHADNPAPDVDPFDAINVDEFESAKA